MALTLIGGTAAMADNIANNLDASVDADAEIMPLNVGASGTTALRVITVNNDGKQGCNLTGHTTLSARVASSDDAVATVSPSSVTFTNCDETKTLTVTAKSTGTAAITLTQTSSNTTAGSFDLSAAQFTVNVAGPANTAPNVTVTGVLHGGTYPYGSVPTAGCNVSDKEDGSPSVEPTHSTISGDNAADGIGSQTATCSYKDTGGLTTTVGATYTIIKATPTIALTCPDRTAYTGFPLAPCSATVSGGAEPTGGVTVTYSSNTDAGIATATAIYAGDRHNADATKSRSFDIIQASSEVTVSCPDSVAFTGSAQTPCTAVATGAGGITESLDVTYGDNTNAGTATASATWAGNVNHEGSTNSKTFTIDKASSTVKVTCTSGPFVYDGFAHEPCSATATGAGGLNQDLTVDYANNTNAGTATASASFAGDANHEGSSGSASFTIAKASSTVTVTCSPTTVTYTGSPLTPCKATATGAGDLSEDLTVGYADNTNAGTATASASFTGDANHEGDSGSAPFTIAKASSTVTVTCEEGPFVYTGSGFEPCKAEVTGAGILPFELDVEYQSNVAAGIAGAYAAYEGDANHEGDHDSAQFTISKAPTTVTLTCPTSVEFSGSALEPCSATVAGAGPFTGEAVITYTNNIGPGLAKATASFGGDDNHLASSAGKSFSILRTVKGFYAPIDMNNTLNTVKAGSTVPFKFEIFEASHEVTETAIVETFIFDKASCVTLTTDDLEWTATGGTSLRYDSTGGQFIQNWQTPKSPGTCWNVTMKTTDGAKIGPALFKLK